MSTPTCCPETLEECHEHPCRTYPAGPPGTPAPGRRPTRCRRAGCRTPGRRACRGLAPPAVLVAGHAGRAGLGRARRADPSVAQSARGLYRVGLHHGVCVRRGADFGPAVAAGAGARKPAAAGRSAPQDTPGRAVADRAGRGLFGLGSAHRQARPPAYAVLRPAPGAGRGLCDRRRTPGRQRAPFAAPAGDRHRHWRAGGIHHRRADRLVTHGKLLDPSGAARAGPGADDGAAAGELLLLSFELVDGGVSDRAGHGVSRRHPDLVGCGQRAQELL